MGRIMAIDYGTKRTGLAVTDPMRIIATALDTVETSKLLVYLKQYFVKEQVDEIIIGLPKQMNNTDSETAPFVRQMVSKINVAFPNLPVKYVDERFTSKIALRAMVDGGMKKKDRRDKQNVDKISATLILQTYMESSH
ncbi:MAG: Holliday junction resolvase RuvX [Cyclobacteriaceae bacterium]|nr:Holliday junction resolvase RuvX [Cyclobacteriaceae bacterium]